jgi:hypothetical protein
MEVNKITPEQETIETPVEVKEEGQPLSSNEKLPHDKELFKLEVWEGENKKKYVNEYFNTHNIAHEFMFKMPTSEIDKFIKSELETKEFEKTTENYKNTLAEIEKEIGSEKLELTKRLQKIVGYIRAMKKLYQAKKLREKYMV